MREPIEPSKEDCCNSGCNPCIFDVYEKHLLLFKKYQKEGDDSKIVENAISELQYTAFIVLENIKLCKSHHQIVFKAKLIKDNNKVFWKPGQHFLIKYMSGSHSCTRAYTPLKHRIINDSDFSVIVKRYNEGVVSQYLCDLKPGDETLWRGPYGSYELSPNKYNRIIMIAQGTGIAPFYSIIQRVLSNDEDMTKLVLYYCCHSTKAILLREELYSWKAYWNFDYTVFASSVNETDVYKYREPIINHKLDIDTVLQLQPFSAKDQILLCGSTQFMTYYQKCLEKDVEIIVLF